MVVRFIVTAMLTFNPTLIYISGFFLGFFFEPEDGGDVFLRNVT
jgi:hypothetical protein